MKLKDLLDDVSIGKKIRRPYFAKGCYLTMYKGKVKYYSDVSKEWVQFNIGRNDLEANDWELYEEDCKYCKGTGKEPNKPCEDPAPLLRNPCRGLADNCLHAICNKL